MVAGNSWYEDTKGMNLKEERVWEAAIEAVGGQENVISDNGQWDEEKQEVVGGYVWTREGLLEFTLGEIMEECSREVRFLGKERIVEIAERAVDTYDYRTW